MTPKPDRTPEDILLDQMEAILALTESPECTREMMMACSEELLAIYDRLKEAMHHDTQ